MEVFIFMYEQSVSINQRENSCCNINSLQENLKRKEKNSAGEEGMRVFGSGFEEFSCGKKVAKFELC